jgi:hypothetical protein
VEWLVLDVNRVARLESVAVAMLDAFTADLAGRGVRLIVVDPWQRALLTSAIAETSTLSAALEHCEDELLGECDLVRSAAVPAAEQDILRDLAPARAERLAELMRMTDLDAGDEIRDLALGLVIRGRLEGRGDGGRHATAVAGAAFGPLTLLEPVGLQWAAVAPSTCLVLTRDARIELADQDPATLAALQEAIAHDLAERLRETAFR